MPKPSLKKEGAQPILVFSDQGRSMGLVADEIIDIVEERLDIEVSSDRPGLLGYAVIKGATTEIIDVGHFLPQAFEDWFRRRDPSAARQARSVLLVDDSAFFRDLLAPLIKAAGYRVVTAASAADALAALKSDARFDLIVTDIEMPEMDGFALAEAVRAMPAAAEVPIIALATMVSAETVERGRAARIPRFRRQVRSRRPGRGDQGTGRRPQSGGMTAMNDTQLSDYVTFTTADQLFGLPIECVQDVFKPSRITRVPLAGPEIAGVLNLRGRIVTAIELRSRLGLAARDAGQVPMAIGIESRGESFGLLVDTVGEVLKLPDDEREPNPINLDRNLGRVAAGVYRLDGHLLVVLDIDRVLDLSPEAAAA